MRTFLERGLEAVRAWTSPLARLRKANRVTPERFVEGSLLAMPFAEQAFETVVSTDCLEHIADEDVPSALAELHRVTRRNLFVQLATTPRTATRGWQLRRSMIALWWERQFFEAGVSQTSLEAQSLLSYESLEKDGWQKITALVLEKIPRAGLKKFPLARLKAERDLHMDMLRETGRQLRTRTSHVTCWRGDSCPRMVWCWMRGRVRAGLWLGAILAHGSPATRVIGLDASAYAAIEYARANFEGDFTNA